MTRMTGPDCAVMCNLINTHTHTHTHTERERHTHAHSYRKSYGMPAGMPGGRTPLVELKEIACPGSRWSWARTSNGRAASGKDNTGLTVVRQGMRVVGVPVGTEQFQRDLLSEAVNGEPAELVRALVPMEDAQTSFQSLRLSATSRLPHLLRTVPPSIT